MTVAEEKKAELEYATPQRGRARGSRLGVPAAALCLYAVGGFGLILGLLYVAPSEADALMRSKPAGAVIGGSMVVAWLGGFGLSVIGTYRERQRRVGVATIVLVCNLALFVAGVALMAFGK
jgi:hypothetical protein